MGLLLNFYTRQLEKIFIASLRYNLYTITFTHCKCTFQWLLINIVVQPLPHPVLGHFHHKRFLICPLAVIAHFHLQPSNHWSAFKLPQLLNIDLIFQYSFHKRLTFTPEVMCIITDLPSTSFFNLLLWFSSSAAQCE